MVVGMSRFRVRNGMEKEVEAAFRNRPHLVDSVPGFLGLETFTDARDASVFYLLTRWTDEDSFRSWHSSPAHKQSHKGIPKGLKLDPAFTEVVVLERIDDAPGTPVWEEIAADAAPFLARYFSASRTLHCIVASVEGVIQSCNAAVVERTKIAREQLVGRMIWDRLTAAAGELLRTRVQSAERCAEEPLLLSFVDAENFPYTLECRLDVQPSGFILVGEPPFKQEDALQEHLVLLNNQLAVLSRENERKRRSLEQTQAKLERTLEELNTSYWHLKKIQEVLPICMECGKVRTGDSQWDEVVEYLKQNALFLSHSYCPDCFGRLEAGLESWEE